MKINDKVSSFPNLSVKIIFIFISEYHKDII
jgi:hypothetical protein